MRSKKQHMRSNVAITAAFEPLVAAAVRDQPGAGEVVKRGLLPHWDGRVEIDLATGKTKYHPGKQPVQP